MLNAGYHYLDLVPKGRDEEGLPYGMASRSEPSPHDRGLAKGDARSLASMSSK